MIYNADRLASGYSLFTYGALSTFGIALFNTGSRLSSNRDLSVRYLSYLFRFNNDLATFNALNAIGVSFFSTRSRTSGNSSLHVIPFRNLFHYNFAAIEAFGILPARSGAGRI